MTARLRKYYNISQAHYNIEVILSLTCTVQSQQFQVIFGMCTGVVSVAAALF